MMAEPVNEITAKVMFKFYGEEPQEFAKLEKDAIFSISLKQTKCTNIKFESPEGKTFEIYIDIIQE